jgi:hypothetical protein
MALSGFYACLYNDGKSGWYGGRIGTTMLESKPLSPEKFREAPDIPYAGSMNTGV